MVRVTCDITIGGLHFTGIVEVQIESSWDTLTDTCKITFPRKYAYKGRTIVRGDKPLLKKKDFVVVNLGYDGHNVKLFEGYIVRIDADTPITVYCEDAAFLCKQNTIAKKSYSSKDKLTLQKLLKDILPSSLPFESPDVSLGAFRISSATPAEVLEALKSQYLLKSWCRDGKLYCGFPYLQTLRHDHTLYFQRDIDDEKSKLEYMLKDEQKIRLKLISIGRDNKRTEVEKGEKDGEQRTLHYIDKDKAFLEKIANDEIERLKYNGYRGTFITFGQHLIKHTSIQHGDVVTLIDKLNPERDGSYFVKKIITKFGFSGFQQEVELDAIVGNQEK
jgi:hypothetical protein